MIKETLLATLVRQKHITEKTKIEVDFIGLDENGAQLPKKRTIFNVKNVTSTPLHPAMMIEVVNPEDGTEAVVYSYDICTIDGMQPQRYAVSKGIAADGIERLKKRRGRKPKIRDAQQ